AAANWWRSVAEAATVVREAYVPGPALPALGPSGAPLYVRRQLRRAVRNFTTIGIPGSRVGLALGFHSGRGGRGGLSAARWFGVVKREGLAARQVAGELGLDSVWSWGWASFAGAPSDPAKADAACVYLWTRDPSLCNAPTVAGRGFDSSRAQPAEGAGRGNARRRKLHARPPAWVEVPPAAQLSARAAAIHPR